VDADEIYLGGLEEGVTGRQTENKALIVVAAEETAMGSDGFACGHTGRFGRSLVGFAEESVEPGSVLHAPTRAWVISRRYVSAMDALCFAGNRRNSTATVFLISGNRYAKPVGLPVNA